MCLKRYRYIYSVAGVYRWNYSKFSNIGDLCWIDIRYILVIHSLGHSNDNFSTSIDTIKQSEVIKETTEIRMKYESVRTKLKYIA